MSPVKLPQLIKQFMFMIAGIHNTQLSSLKYAKMGSLLCDVTVTLKRQGKIESILFSEAGYICLQANICLTLLPKNAHGITQRPTQLWDVQKNRKKWKIKKLNMGEIILAVGTIILTGDTSSLPYTHSCRIS